MIFSMFKNTWNFNLLHLKKSRLNYFFKNILSKKIIYTIYTIIYGATLLGKMISVLQKQTWNFNLLHLKKSRLNYFFKSILSKKIIYTIYTIIYGATLQGKMSSVLQRQKLSLPGWTAQFLHFADKLSWITSFKNFYGLPDFKNSANINFRRWQHIEIKKKINFYVFVSFYFILFFGFVIHLILPIKPSNFYEIIIIIVYNVFDQCIFINVRNVFVFGKLRDKEYTFKNNIRHDHFLL